MTFDFVKVTIKSRFCVGSTINFVHYVEKYNTGLSTFRDRFSPHTAFVVGYEGYPVEEFLSADLRLLFK